MIMTEFENLLSGVSDQNEKTVEYPNSGSTKSRLNLASVGKLFGDDGIATFVASAAEKRCPDDDNETTLVWLEGSDRQDDNDMSCSVSEGKMCSDNDNDVGSMLAFDEGHEVGEGTERGGNGDGESGSLAGVGGGKICADDGEVILLSSAGSSKDFRNRNLGPSSKMLGWLTQVAKDPCNPDIGILPERSKWKLWSGEEEYWKQVLLTREAVCIRRATDTNSERCVLQGKQKMHPSLYDDEFGSDLQPSCSQRLPSLRTSQARPCSDASSSGTHSDLDVYSSSTANTDDVPGKRYLRSGDSSVGLGGSSTRKRIPVGPFFQAKVPEWTGVASESDSKWLGTRVWPSGCTNSRLIVERDPIGKGRQDSCGCHIPKSVECVRFHVSERRMRLKLELGLAFFIWKFGTMGEGVALSWTEGDKKKFEATVTSTPPRMGKRLWDGIHKSFPHKSREDLVSYYFNVFLLQRRQSQNRSTPININSDEDDDDDDYEESEIKSNTISHDRSKQPHKKARR